MSPQLRLLVYFRGRVGDSQGTPLRCRNLTRWLCSQPGVSGALVSRDAPETLASVVPGVTHYPVDRPEDGPRQLASAVADFDPDVVYAHTHKGMTDLAHLDLQRALKVVDLHGDLPAWRLEHTWRPWLWRIYWFLRERWRERGDIPRIDGFTVVSRPLEERIESLGKPVIRLWGGVDPEVFAPVPRRSNEHLLVAYAGNFNPYHGIGTVIEGVARANQDGAHLRLLLIGAIEEYPQVRAIAEQTLASSVEFSGLVPYEEVPRRLAEADILVIPRAVSRTALTTYPSKLSEYLATGRPVIATALGEANEVIEDGRNGLLVPPASSAALAAAFDRLSEPELRRRIGEAGRETARSELSWQVVASRALDFIRDLESEGRTP